MISTMPPRRRLPRGLANKKARIAVKGNSWQNVFPDQHSRLSGLVGPRSGRLIDDRRIRSTRAAMAWPPPAMGILCAHWSS